jgi:hypothetical protein
MFFSLIPMVGLVWWRGADGLFRVLTAGVVFRSHHLFVTGVADRHRVVSTGGKQDTQTIHQMQALGE